MSNTSIIFLILIGGFLLIGFLTSLVQWIMGLQSELRYLNMEIRRTEGREQQYYRKERRRLLLSWLPFIRR